jgi:general secretion pathway protein B
MSFILDALRKSEHERQRRDGPDIAHPHGSPRRTAFALPLPWVLAIVALLALNLVVVLAVVMRGEGQQTVHSPPPDDPALVASSPAPAAQQVPAAAGLGDEVSLDTLPPPQPTAMPVTAPYSAPAAGIPRLAAPDLSSPGLADPAAAQTSMQAPPAGDRLPTIHELNLRGANALPPLRLDIHVYASEPGGRFVSINMRHYKEGERIQEGMLLERITPDGVILDRDGMRFVLPRQ